MSAAETSGALLEHLVEREATGLLQYFIRRVDDPQDAADLVSETLLVAWRRHTSIPTDEDEARMWLYGVGRRVLSTHWRGRRRRDELNQRLRDSLTVASRWANVEPSIDGVRDAIAELKPSDRELITLVYWDGFTLTEAATLLHIKPATARSRMARARAALKRRLDDDPAGALVVATA